MQVFCEFYLFKLIEVIKFSFHSVSIQRRKQISIKYCDIYFGIEMIAVRHCSFRVPWSSANLDKSLDLEKLIIAGAGEVNFDFPFSSQS